MDFLELASSFLSSIWDFLVQIFTFLSDRLYQIIEFFNFIFSVVFEIPDILINIFDNLPGFMQIGITVVFNGILLVFVLKIIKMVRDCFV